MKKFLKKSVENLGGYLFSRDSLPTGVNWLRDIQRAGALGSTPTFFDVGANVGQTVLELQAAYRHSRVYAFEPFAATREILINRLKGTSGVTVVPFAMGSVPSELLARQNARSEMSSLLSQAAGLGDAPNELIHIETIDRYCAQQNIYSIDILKTDTEGFDLEVLRGASKLLSEQKVKYVYTEVSFCPDRSHLTPFMPMMELMTAWNYRFLGLYETWPLHFFDEPTVFCNALFVAPSVREHSLVNRRSTGSLVA
jgi:FkbM family methyltransferase